MLNEIFTWLNNLLSGNIWIALTGSFLWGVLSILLSPCHLSSIPLIIGYVSGSSLTLKKTFSLSLVFSAGILITVALIGVITASLGRLTGDVGEIGNFIVPVVFIIAGLYLLNVIKFQFGGIDGRNLKSTGYVKALSLGIILGIGLGPCTFAFMAPVLGIVFNLAQNNLAISLFILLAFAVGHCTVITGAGTLSKYIQLYLNWNENSNAVSIIKKVCGALIILSGIYLIYSASI
jgi:cytochrome c-type biogenesis protein